MREGKPKLVKNHHFSLHTLLPFFPEFGGKTLSFESGSSLYFSWSHAPWAPSPAAYLAAVNKHWWFLFSGDKLSLVICGFMYYIQKVFLQSFFTMVLEVCSHSESSDSYLSGKSELCLLLSPEGPAPPQLWPAGRYPCRVLRSRYILQFGLPCFWVFKARNSQTALPILRWHLVRDFM